MDRANSPGGGVIILIKNTIAYFEENTTSINGIETIAVSLTNTYPNFTIIAAYKPPNKRTNFTDLNNLLSRLSSYILLGDLNAKHVQFGCRVTNAAGAQLLKYVVTNGIKVISPPEPTYYPYDPIRLPDILDIGITNINVNFHSTPHFELDSDHIPVLISTDQIPPPHSPTPALNTYNLNWTKFKNLIQKQIPNFKILNSPAEIDQTISQLNNIIINTIGKLNPVRPITLRKHTADKLPQSIIKIIETKNKTRRLWMALRIPSLKKELNTLTKISRKALEHYKQTKYNNIIHSLNTSNNSLWNFTKRILRKKL